MTATWPTTVPVYALAGSWTETPEINVAKNELEFGTPEFRRRTAILSYDIKTEIHISSAQWQLLLDFYEDTLLDGVLPFTLTDPRTGASATFTFKGAMTAKAVAPYYYEVSLDLRRMP